MEKRDCLTRRQLWSLSFLALLAPAMRLLPGWSAEIAKSVSWLCPLAALPVLLAVNALISALLKNRRPGEGLGGIIRRALGKWAGGGVLMLFALWLTFYAGFLLRSGAERFITTVYPNSGPETFVIIMLIMGLLAALGRTRALGRAAEIFQPILAVILGLVLLFALLETDFTRLLPVTKRDVVPVLLGTAPVADVVSLVLVNVAFLDGLTPAEGGRGRLFSLWTALMCLMLTALIAATVGSFGSELTARLGHPFFVLVRNTKLFGAVERLEALVTTLWVFSDFVLVSLSLIIGSGAARLALGFPTDLRQQRLLSMKNGRFIIWLCTAAALTVALFIAPTAFDLAVYSREVVPLINLILSFGVMPAVLVIGKLRKKI